MDIGRIPLSAGAGIAGANHTAAPAMSAETAAQQRELIKAVKAINAGELLGEDKELTFVFDRDTNRTVARIVKKDTREVVMQVPLESVIRMAQDRERA